VQKYVSRIQLLEYAWKIKEGKMKVKLEYLEGIVKATNSETGEAIEGDFYCSPAFSDFYREIKQTFGEQMLRYDYKTRELSKIPMSKSLQVPRCTLEIELGSKEVKHDLH
jgi:hypothetical protein